MRRFVRNTALLLPAVMLVWVVWPTMGNKGVAGALVNKYKFKDALPLAESLRDKLKG